MLAGRIVIVTGASSGIGREVCLALAVHGAQVVAVGRDSARLQETALRMRARSATTPAALCLSLDVAREADMQRMAALTLEAFGRIDALVHSAGVLRARGAGLKTVAKLPAAEWDEVLDINLRGTWLANRAVLPAMRSAGRGDILNLSSKSGRTGLAYDAPYCASKFGVIGLSEALAAEVADAGVRVQVLLPGRFDTEVLQQTGPLPHPEGIPPPCRVADLVTWMLSMPDDCRLVAPVIDPMDRSGLPGTWGVRQGGRAAPTTLHLEDKTMNSPFLSAASHLQDKVVVVTGGSGGIGLATACAVGALGAPVVVADIDGERVAAAARQVEAAGARAAIGVAMDVRVEDDHSRLVQATLDRFGRIDALVVCAGILRKRGTPPKVLVDVTTDEWDDVMAINLRGVFLANRAVLPTMIAQRSGTIINLSSVQGLQGRAYDGPYCASKFGVIGLSQAVADEVRTYGVKVQALMPAAVATPMWEQNKPAPMPGDAIPPERVADLIVFMLLQPDDTMIVGPVIAPVGARKRRAAVAAPPDMPRNPA